MAMAMFEKSRIAMMLILLLMCGVHVSQCCSSSAHQDERDGAGDNTAPEGGGKALCMTYIVCRLRYGDLKMKLNMNIRYLHITPLYFS